MYSLWFRISKGTPEEQNTIPTHMEVVNIMVPSKAILGFPLKLAMYHMTLRNEILQSQVEIMGLKYGTLTL